MKDATAITIMLWGKTTLRGLDPKIQKALSDTARELEKDYFIEQAYVGVQHVYVKTFGCNLENFRSTFIAKFHRNLWASMAQEEDVTVYVDDSRYYREGCVTHDRILEFPVFTAFIYKTKQRKNLNVAIRNNQKQCAYIYFWEYFYQRDKLSPQE